MPIRGANPETAGQNTLTVLLVDNHVTFRRAIKRLLQRGGWSDITEATSGEEAVQLLSKALRDVVVLDYRLPGMNGAETARRMRGIAPALNIVLLSSHSEPAYIKDAFEAGVDAYIAKTRAAEQLVPAIRDIAAGTCCCGRSLLRARTSARR
jgi:DNA-binding NarL/FixJ family response regulator